MSSINTNVSAMTALKTLSMTNKALDETQGRIATGYRVAEASDNAAYWSIATGMRTQTGGLSAVQDALGLGAAIVDTAYTPWTTLSGSRSRSSTSMWRAKRPVSTPAIIDAEIVRAEGSGRDSLRRAPRSRVCNLLATGGTDQDVVTGYEAGTGVTTMTVAAYDLQAEVATMTDIPLRRKTRHHAMSAAAATLGSAKSRIATQQTFTAT